MEVAADDFGQLQEIGCFDWQMTKSVLQALLVMYVSLPKCLAWKVTELSERLECLVTVESDPPW
jgi:hypothetical protein